MWGAICMTSGWHLKAEPEVGLVVQSADLNVHHARSPVAAEAEEACERRMGDPAWIENAYPVAKIKEPARPNQNLPVIGVRNSLQGIQDRFAQIVGVRHLIKADAMVKKVDHRIESPV